MWTATPFPIYAATTTTLSPQELSWFVDNTVTKRLLAVPGVAQISRSGGVSREIRVELDPPRLQALGLTAAEVNDQLRALNLDAPGGRAQVGGGEQAIRVLGGAKTAEALAETQIMASGGRSFRLREIADVRDGVEEVRSIARLNGRPATAFGIFKAKGASDVSVSRAAQAELDKIQLETPAVHMTLISTTVDHTLRTYHSSLNALIEGSILAVVVVWLFLRSWRATVISALAIPLSAIPTFAFMQWMGFTLNMITLLGLSLVAGVLVDDAIVEIENIVRHIRMGKSGYQAALDAADEIGLAVVATSFTIIAVFLPVSFMGGITGQFFKQFGLTVAVAVFISLMVARLITPVLAAYSLRGAEVGVQHADGPIMTFYMSLLRWCVANRWKTIGAGAAFAALSVVALSIIPQAFMPSEDFASSQLSIELPPGVTLEDTSRVSAAAAALLRKSPEVTDLIEFVGQGDLGEVQSAVIYISLVPRSERKMSQKEWEQRMMPILNQVPDGHLNFSNQSAGGGGRDIQLYLTGDDPPLVRANRLIKLIAEMQGVNEIRTPRISGRSAASGNRRAPAARHRRAIGGERAEHQPDDTHRHARRSAAERRQVLPERPPDSDPGQSDRERPAATCRRWRTSPCRRPPAPPCRSKSVADLSFGQGPSAVRRYNQSRRVFLEADLSPGMRTRYRHEEDLCAADAEESAAGRASGEARQYRILSGR